MFSRLNIVADHIACPNNLDKFIDMEVEDEEYGHVLQEAEFLEYCDS